ncbi:S1 family peptidase [Amycolatopsis anabasis]|uniref:S1 family peptidase n=1 Tax=Amycolatopsis anabasis TaxID=1840409 RepID=UPI00131B3125|nr:trypsin-like serine protease [Amycolatopsis anabasis]
MAVLALAGSMLFPGTAAADDDVSTRIVGGHEAVGQTDYVAALHADVRGGVQGKFFCGGAVLFREWVVTAAHCGVQAPSREAATQLQVDPQVAAIPVQDRQLWVRVGSKFRDTGGEIAYVTAIYVPQGYVWGGPNDVALFKLDHAVDVQQIQLAPKPARPGAEVIAYGWGYDQPSSNGTPPRRLQQLETTVVPPSRCDGVIGKGDICLDNPNGRDGVCYGDSGTAGVEVVNGVPKLIGIASRIADRRCGLSPAVYTSAAEHGQWLYDTARTGGAPPSALVRAIEVPHPGASHPVQRPRLEPAPAA